MASNPPSRLTVLLSLAAPDGTTRYVDQLVDGRADTVTYRFFSWREALLGRYDVLHVHWPEYLTRAPSAWRRMVRRGLLRMLLFRLGRRQRQPWSPALVRTVHNLHPHEPVAPPEARLLTRLDERTDLHIYLNSSIVDPKANSVVIRHGHYRDRYPLSVIPRQVQGRLLYFGFIRPYKGVDQLLGSFSAFEGPELSLRLVGRPSVGWAEVIEEACRGDQRISAVLEYVSDTTLAEEVYRAQLVVLPFYEMYNSATILVALSLDRPVLVPRTPANELLATEVGPGWIHFFTGELTAARLQAALEAVVSRPPRERPRLEGRDWSSVGRRHLDAYRRALRGIPSAIHPSESAPQPGETR